VGALVDSVSEVIGIADESISPIGDLAIPFDKDIVRGVAKWEARFITLFQTAGLFADTAAREA
jgi:chemotaxis signal transduction protein